MELTTLADVPNPGRETSTGGIPGEVQLAPARRAAPPRREGQQDVAEVSITLRIVFKEEGVEYRASPQGRYRPELPIFRCQQEFGHRLE
jgi:hypothetical protein